MSYFLRNKKQEFEKIKKERKKLTRRTVDVLA
jgi:hypothetical protein